MIDFVLSEVNVYIIGIVIEKIESVIDLNNLFGDEDIQIDENEDGEEL